MLITEFSEIVEIKLKRQGKTKKYLSDLIGKSTVYTIQVINGYQQGEKADAYRQIIATDLGIVLAEVGGK